MNTPAGALSKKPNDLLVLVALLVCHAQAQGPLEPSGSWPQWRGPDRSNKSSETGLLKDWPTNGPPLLWTVTGLGEGITSMAVAGGKAYTLGYRDGGEFVFALDAASGETLWTSRIGGLSTNIPMSSLMRWLSPRVPTVDEERLYAITSLGELACLSVADGHRVWQKSYPGDFESQGRNWGYCDYPLVDGEHLICVPGGVETKVVALNKRSGEVVWKTALPGTETSYYAAPVISIAGGIRHYVVFLQKGLTGIAASDGRVLWQYGKTAARLANSYTPIVQGDLVFSANGYGGGMALLKLVREGDVITAVEQYRRKFNFSPFQDNTVLVDDHIYTIQGASQAVCMELKTGDLVWGPIGSNTQRRAAVIYADGHLFVRRSDGSVILVETTPKQYVEKASFRIPAPEEVSGVTSPVIAGGRLYLRDNSRLLCYDIRGDALTRVRSEPRQLAVTLTATNSGSPQLTAGHQSSDSEGLLDAIYIPTPADVVEEMLEVANLTANSVLYDLGSGDGRIVIKAAQKYGCRAVGYELDSKLAEEARAAVTTNGLEHLVRIEQTNLFTADLSGADVIAVYLPTDLLQRLRPQFEKLKPGARIVSHQFQIPGIPPSTTMDFVSREDGDRHRVFVWTTPLGHDAPGLVSAVGNSNAAEHASFKGASNPDVIDVRGVGFMTPECVVWDKAADVYLVSNIHGHSLHKDDNGFISRVRPDGTVEALKWIDGTKEEVTLHAPKGMAIMRDSLWVTDIDVVRQFDLKSGRPLGEIAVEGASFLNDVAFAGHAEHEGANLIVTDTGLERDGEAGLKPNGKPSLVQIDTLTRQVTVQTMREVKGYFRELRQSNVFGPIDDTDGGELAQKFNSEQPYGLPNGVAFLGVGYAMVTWDTGYLYILAAHDRGGMTDAYKLPKSQLDGLVQWIHTDPDIRKRSNGWLVSSWEGGCVYELRSRFPRGQDAGITKLVKDLRAPADIDYDAKRNRVLIPLFLDDTLLIRPGPKPTPAAGMKQREGQ